MEQAIENQKIYCYHCHTKVQLKSLFFECVSCGSGKSFDDLVEQSDAQNKTGAQLVEALLSVRCKTDEKPLSSICTICRRNLHFSLTMLHTPIIALVSGRRAGKSCYLGSLRKQLAEIEVLRTSYKARGTRKLEDIYQSLLYEKKLPYPDRLDEEGHTLPCCIRVGRYPEKGRIVGQSVITYNVAGEAFRPPAPNVVDDTEFVSQLEQFAPFLGGAMITGIIMVVDPYTCFPIKAMVKLPEQPLDNDLNQDGVETHDAEWKDYAPEEILRIMTTYIQMNNPTSKDGKMPIVLALVLNKLDLFLGEDVASPIRDAARHYQATLEKVRGDFFESLFIQNAAVEVQCRKIHASALDLFQTLDIHNLYREASESFNSVHCFAASSLGHAPDSDRLTSPILPIGPEFPFLWLVQRAKDIRMS